MVTAFVLCQGLYSATGEIPVFTIGILALDTTGIKADTFVLETGETFCPKYGNTDGVVGSYYEKKLLFEQEIEQEELIHKAYTKEDSAALETAREQVTQENLVSTEYFAIDYVSMESKESLSGAFASGIFGLEWYCKSQNLDAVLLVSSRKIFDNSRILIEYFSMVGKQRTIIFDRLCLNQDLPSLQKDLALALIKATGREDIAGISLENVPIGLEILANGNTLDVFSSQAFLLAGTYEFSFNAFGYDGKTSTVVVEKGVQNLVDASLKRRTYGNLSLISLSGNGSWFVDGAPAGYSTALTLENYTLPVAAILTKEGFVTKAIQTRKVQNNLVFDLKPQWMDDTTLLGKAQNDFYSSLQNAIFMFGLYVACTTLSNTNGLDSQFWQPVLVATSGLTLVSSVNMIKSLASYASIARSNNR
jgi:hypothetical protein